MSRQSLEEERLIRIDRSDNWMTWLDPRCEDHRASLDMLGRPGLWRAVRQADGGLVTTFDCPSPAAFDHVQQGPLPLPTELEATISAWANQAANGAVSDTWCAPSREDVTSGIDANRLNVQAGPHVIRGNLECDASGLRLSFSELVRFDDRLSEARIAWLRELCLDAQTHWQFVRFGVVEGRVRAEVDLTGVPHELTQPLTVWALEALVLAVEWALPACALIADPDLECAFLDDSPAWSIDAARHSTSEGAGPIETNADSKPQENRNASDNHSIPS